MVFTLYKVDTSPPVRAVLMTIEALKIPQDEINYFEINVFEKEHLNEDYMKINPQQTVPTLKDDDFVLWDSHAIAGYLVAKYGKDDSLYPKDFKKRAVVDSRLHYDTGVLFPLCRDTGHTILFYGKTEYPQENLDKINTSYETVERLLTSPWMAGEEMTIADICCVATISTMNEILPINAELFPRMTAWFARLKKEGFYKKGNEKGLEDMKHLVKSRVIQNLNQTN